MRIALSRLSQKFWYCIRISEFYKSKFDILVRVSDILYTTFELDFSVSFNLFNKHYFSVPKTRLPCFVLYHVFFVILLLLAPWSVFLVSHPKPLNGRAPQGFLHITFFSFFVLISVDITLSQGSPYHLYVNDPPILSSVSILLL